MLKKLELEEIRSYCQCPAKYHMGDLLGVGLAAFFGLDGLRRIGQPLQFIGFEPTERIADDHAPARIGGHIGAASMESGSQEQQGRARLNGRDDRGIGARPRRSGL